MTTITIVVPCYNEAQRLAPAGFLPLLEQPGWRLLFVNDGSTDDTAGVLETTRHLNPKQIDVLTLEENQGKSEAVRRGLLAAIEAGADIVGYYDADLATPTSDLQRIVAALDSPQVHLVLGSRIKLLGREIQRSLRRHLTGRVFATLASMSLELPVYDTQCGAKALRVTPLLREALQAHFHSRWIFDVELIGRLLSLGLTIDAFLEVPLQSWHDVRGSKLTTRAMATSLLDLGRIAWDRRQRAR
jgi:glycosyltransferase involved in cell wall biosynthesis